MFKALKYDNIIATHTICRSFRGTFILSLILLNILPGCKCNTDMVNRGLLLLPIVCYLFFTYVFVTARDFPLLIYFVK